MEWSGNQKDIFNFVENGTGNAFVEAVAGSGKTTTGVESLKYIDEDDDALYLAFNKAIATEMQDRVPDGVSARTFNSFGWRICLKTKGRYVALDARKNQNILKHDIMEINDYSPKDEKTLFYKIRGAISKLIDLAKANYIREPENKDWWLLCEKYGIDTPNTLKPPEQSLFFIYLNSTWQKSIEMFNIMDFSDQVFMPVYYDWRFPRYEFVFVDEAQDLNPIQIEALKKIRGNPRIVCVGDRNQSIYAFRGADSEAVPRLIQELECKILPLSVTYRCPKVIVARAKEIVPQIEAAPNAPEGIERSISQFKLDEELQENDFVLCRITAPLISQCFSLLKLNKKAYIKGRDIGQKLMTFVDSFNEYQVSRLLSKMDEYVYKATGQLLEQDKEAEAEELKDKAECINVIAMGLNNVQELRRKIEGLFKDDGKGICLSTIHKAKGLEANRIFIMKPDLLPHPAAKTPEALQQEMNLKYVAMTRVKFDEKSDGELVWVR